MISDLDKKLNILVVHNYYKMSGGEDTVFHNEVELLKSHGHNVITYTRNNREIDSFNTLKKMLVPFMYMFNLKTYIDLKKLIKKNNIDILHVHNTLSLIGGAAYFAGIHCNVPVVQTVHNFRFVCPNGLLCRDGQICEECINKSLFNAIKNKCYHNSRIQTLAIVAAIKFQRLIGIYKKINFICLTDFNRKTLLNVSSIDPNKVFVKPNSCPNFEGEIISYNERKNYYCFVGRLDEYKGIRPLLESLVGIPNVQLNICGDGPLRDWCKLFIENNNLKCNLLGNIEHNKVLEIIANSKGLIFPSIWYEGLPMTIIEAFSTGTPVFGRNVGNIPSIIDNTILGILLDDFNNLSRIFYNRDFTCDAIYYHFNKKYSDDKNYENMLEIYISLICVNSSTKRGR